MRLSTTVLVTALCITVVNSIPVPENNGLESQALDRLVMVEAEKDTALRNKRTIGILRQLFPEISQDINPEAENRVSEAVSSDDQPKESAAAESQNNEIRVQFADEKQNEAAEQELAPLDDIDDSDDENRNKRFLNSNGSSGGGSGAGSGNFLFDIIRQAADGAARAAGTVYRVVAGTQSLGLGLSASRDVGPAPPPAAPGAPPAPAAPAAPAPGNATRPSLVAGSGSSSSGQSDPAAGAPSPGGGQEAVPGPITRLFVIANRGISNLIQDLILRLAATSERIVNFKARLITSII
ncbi:uncharacterized protein LOC127284458 isoform X1 [Leptopilina boulardi]|uniref:uncharacterized protein LOC127284458 isoform X1 n=1 Tax=Leptopilina boulardi TaxID=63433 RepID=UPI0021F663FD|nr:uncharacterized protein LOC127284458 isoform X1 [Leptopilina boulardi]